ncbi:MAG: 1-acyl-sn-glycerol-3-phosphate acyltransferase [Bacteroidota bacterium]
MESVQHYIKEGILYEPVIPSIQEWPINLLFKQKHAFYDAVVQDAIQALNHRKDREDTSLDRYVARAMYLERIRMNEDPWKVDPKDESRFWKGIKKNLVRYEQLENAPESAALHSQEMLELIVRRYANEIISTFKPATYQFAKRFLPFFFSTLLNASAGKTIRSVINHSVQLQERVHLKGETELLRKLTKIGTIILVPTHISNIDSILVGWGVHALGLPAFTYGAGLNLYNNKILARFMTRLGAYTVDRRKKNAIYRATLNAYATQATMRGTHHIFFPGGTRSRSGEIEKKLKLGLLSTAIEAQRRNFLAPPQAVSEKVFIVPLVMSYNFVFEAKSLIKQHLNRTGEDQYYVLDKESSDITKILRFIWTTFSQSSDIVLSFGKPMDVFGNFVDESGHSYDDAGRPLDIKAYFMNRGQITQDHQRDLMYTQLLSERIVERYHIENYVFASHLVAFVGFQILRKRRPELDLYAILRLPPDERNLDLTEYRKVLERVYQRLRELSDQGKVKLPTHMLNDPMSIIEYGIKNLGIYHPKRPIKMKDDQILTLNNMNLIYYYHNRLVGYELESLI